MNILYVVKSKLDNQYRYRVQNVLDALMVGGDGLSVGYILTHALKEVGVLDGIDVLVIERQTAKNEGVLNLIREVKERGVKILMDLDDLVFNYKDVFLIKNTVREKSLFYWLGYVWGVRRIAKRVDGFIVTNEFLGEKIKRSFGKPYRVIPNSLSREQVEVSEKCLKNKKHKGFVVGYFSGSPTHAKDFRLVEPELVKFLKKHDDAKLMVVGYMKFSGEMKKMIESGKVEFKKPVDYLKLQELMARVDVNIAPLVINDFTNCKSELKFFEAAAVETTTIASPNYSFKKAIKDGKNGFLAQPGEWYDKLEHLYSHPEENQKIAKRAREYALKHYYGKEFLNEVEEAYGYFAK